VSYPITTPRWSKAAKRPIEIDTVMAKSSRMLLVEKEFESNTVEFLRIDPAKRPKKIRKRL